MAGRGLNLLFWSLIALVLWAGTEISGSLATGLTVLSVALWVIIGLVAVWLLLFAGARPSFLKRDDDER